MSKEEDAYEREHDFVEELGEGSDESVNNDLNSRRNKGYPSDEDPQDFYRWKRWRADPDAKTDFRGLVDKDVSFAKLSGNLPSIQQLNFLAGTIQLIQGRLVDNAITEEDAVAFSEVINVLKVNYKFDLVSSRALGNDREAVLDNITSIKKEISKRKEKDGKGFGLGGG